MTKRGAMLLVAIGCVAAVAFTTRIRHEMADFDVYRVAGGRAAAAESLYRADDGHYQFKYFPAFALLFIPLATLPELPARAIWFALSVACLAGLLALSLRLLPKRLVPSHVLVLATLVTLGKFYGHELGLGQVNLLFGAASVGALALLHRGRNEAAGALFGAATIVKPYGLLFLVYLLAIRRVRASIACAAVVLLVLVMPAVVYGLQGNVDLLQRWWETVTVSTPATLANQDNVSLAAMSARWLGPGTAADGLTVALSLALVAVFGTVIALRRPGVRPEYLEVALLLTGVALLSPQGWDYVLLLSTPAVMLIVNALPRFDRALRIATIAGLAAIGLSLFDVLGREAYARFMELSILTLLYLALIGVLLYIRLKKLE